MKILSTPRNNYANFETGASYHNDRGKLTTQVKILQQKRKIYLIYKEKQCQNT